jgi:signal transduction histidine kinase
MKFCTVGLDSDLSEHCRATIAEVTAGRDAELLDSDLSDGIPEADVYICEFRTQLSPEWLRPEILARSLFVVEPRRLQQLRAALGNLRAGILLKPVHPAALRPFLEHCVRQHTPVVIETEESCKAEHDDLLECLLSVNLRLQQYDQARNNFLARAVHDFRAPLTAVGGYCGLLIEQRLGPLSPVQVDLLNRMQHSIKRVSRLADAMFDLSAGQRTKDELNLRKGDVEACIAQAVHEVTPQADEKQIRIGIAVEHPHRPLVFDSAKLEQVLVNLLENACKFTSKRGTIDISAYPVFWNQELKRQPRRDEAATDLSLPIELPNAYRIDVVDSGMGIAAEHLESIFEEYTTYSGGKDRSGAGLGLAICRMVVNEHRGCIWAESGPQGAQFSFIIPNSGVAAERWAGREHPAAATASA